mgnify:CR=1 FL=1
MPKNYCIMQIWAESGKSALPICNYSQILYQFLTFTQNLKRSQTIIYNKGSDTHFSWDHCLIQLHFLFYCFLSEKRKLHHSSASFLLQVSFYTLYSYAFIPYFAAICSNTSGSNSLAIYSVSPFSDILATSFSVFSRSCFIPF